MLKSTYDHHLSSVNAREYRYDFSAHYSFNLLFHANLVWKWIIGIKKKYIYIFRSYCERIQVASNCRWQEQLARSLAMGYRNSKKRSANLRWQFTDEPLDFDCRALLTLVSCSVTFIHCLVFKNSIFNLDTRVIGTKFVLECYAVRHFQRSNRRALWPVFTSIRNTIESSYTMTSPSSSWRSPLNWLSGLHLSAYLHPNSTRNSAPIPPSLDGVTS